MTDKSEAHLACRRTDVEIQRKIDRGIWRPSLDTGHVYSTEKHQNLKESTNPDGYLTIGCNGYRTLPVSRIIWIAAHGIPDFGMEVDHVNGNRQDNRLENLRLVSHAENMRLALAALTFNDAQDIRSKYHKGRTQSSLAKEYSVSTYTINQIVNNKRYISRPPHERCANLAKRQMEALDSETMAEICTEYAGGASYVQIARRRNIAVTTVKAIIRRGCVGVNV